MVKDTGKRNQLFTGLPEPTLRRMPEYLHFLQRAWERGVIDISAPYIGRELNLDPTQVVKDFAITGVKGKPKVGYNTYELIQNIEEYIGFNRTNEAILAGAGNLGSAILSYAQFQGFGIKIIAAFDADPSKTGLIKGNVNIFAIERIHELLHRLKVQIGIITTPAAAAQETADTMTACGIKAIWNFAPVTLKVPDDVIVQNTSMYANVAVLLKKHQLLQEQFRIVENV